MKTSCALVGLLLVGCNAGYDWPAQQEEGPRTETPIDWLKIRYGEPRPPDCTQDADCGDGCCIQLNNHYQKCYPDDDEACHIRWESPAPAGLPLWDPNAAARYTGDFDADLIEASVVDVWGSGRSRIYKLSNGQYWEAIAPSKDPSVGQTVKIAPNPYRYNMDAGGVITSIDLLGVLQLPVIADTEVWGTFAGMEQQGLYELELAGWWRVSEASASRDPRVILTSPNNRDFWLYTASVAQAPVDPAEVYADGEVLSASATDFALSDGTRWRYMLARPLDPAPVGARAVVFNLAVFDDRHIDHAGPQRYCWHEGGMSFGEWVAPINE